MAVTQTISSPESVDELMRVTSSAGWMQMAALGGIVAAVLAWSALTDAPIKAKGMLPGAQGVAEVTLASRGRLTELEVGPGDTIARGDLVALVEQPELQNQIALRETLRLPFALCRPSPAVDDAVEVAALDALPPLLPDVESAGRAFIGTLVGHDAA